MHREKVMAYASGGYYVDGKTPADLGREMAGYVELGFKAVKMKTGRLSPAEEETRVAAAREAIGPDVVLMLDVNNGWADLPTALEYTRRFEELRPVLDRGAVPARRDRPARAPREAHVDDHRDRRDRGRPLALPRADRQPAAPRSCRPTRPCAAASRSGAASPRTPTAAASR